jgi:hypothetical protein
MSKLVTDKQRAVLAAGVAWLYDTVQPAHAILQHHGITQRAGHNRLLGFCPVGYRGHPVVTVADTEADIHDDRPTDEEADEWVALLADLGHPVVDRWRGGPTPTVCLSLKDRAHSSLRAIVAAYLRGCPDHTHPLCGWTGCPWHRDGRAAVVMPDWPKARIDA